MNTLLRFLGKTVLNGAALLAVQEIFVGSFVLRGGTQGLVVAAVVLAFLNVFVRPVVRFLTTPLRWLSFGLFNIVINLFILWLADAVLASLTITDFWTLFWASLIVAVANTLI